MGDAQGVELVTRGVRRQSQRKMVENESVQGSMKRSDEDANQPMLLTREFGLADFVAKLISSPIEAAMSAAVIEVVATLRGGPTQCLIIRERQRDVLR